MRSLADKQLNVASFEAVLSEWAEEVLALDVPKHSWQGVALDGKVLKGSREGDVPGSTCWHCWPTNSGSPLTKVLCLGRRTSIRRAYRSCRDSS